MNPYLTRASVLALSLGAGTAAFAARPNDKPFVIEGRSFVSQDAFIESGLRCATPNVDEIGAAEIQADIAARLRAGGREPGTGAPPAGGATIGVYVHVILSSAGHGNVSNKQINDQMRVLNDAFAPWGWQFQLLNVDWTVNDAWYSMTLGTTAEAEAKMALHQGSADDLNLYIAGIQGWLGWSTYPWNYAATPWDDGVVILNSTLPGGTNVPYDLGDTATHEVGHWMGLYHTFQGGCSRAGDRIDDTPGERSPASGCPEGRDTCTAKKSDGPDPIHNFMDYSDDACMFEFTTDQGARLEAVFSAYRLGR